MKGVFEKWKYITKTKVSFNDDWAERIIVKRKYYISKNCTLKEVLH